MISPTQPASAKRPHTVTSRRFLATRTSGRFLDFIRPGKPVENSYIESFNDRLRDEFLNVEVFFTMADVRDKLERWREDYNEVRPHSALADHPPEVFAASWAATAAPLSGTKSGRPRKPASGNSLQILA